MNTLTRNTLVYITSVDKIKRSRKQLPQYVTNYIRTLQQIDRVTKSGWYLIQTGDYECPTITIPKKHLKVFKPYLSDYNFTTKELNLFRILRLNLNAFWLGKIPTLENLDLTLGGSKQIQASIEEFKTMLAKLDLQVEATTSLKSILNGLQPFLDYYICE